MGAFIDRHQSKILAAVVVLSAAGLIWLDGQRRQLLPTGQVAPGFTMSLLDGQKDITLTSLRGQPVVLDFWATWCGPCRHSLPHLDALSRRYTGKVKFFAVDAEGEDEALERETRDQLGLKIPIAVAGRPAAGLYRVDSLPTTVLLDRNGKVSDTFIGEVDPVELSNAIDKML